MAQKKIKRKEKRWAFYKWITIIVFSGSATILWYLYCFFSMMAKAIHRRQSYEPGEAGYEAARRADIIEGSPWFSVISVMWVGTLLIIGVWIFSFSLEISRWFLNKGNLAKQIKIFWLFMLSIVLIYTIPFCIGLFYPRAAFLSPLMEAMLLWPVYIILSIWEMFFDAIYYFTFTINEPA